MDLKVCSFNCGSFKRKDEIVKLLMNRNDIILLQETLLIESEVNCLDYLNDNFDYFASPSIVNSNYVGRPKGGMAIYFKKSISNYVTPHYFHNRILGITLKINNFKLLMLNVYMPCDYRNIESLITYRSCLAEIHEILHSNTVDEILLVGDMNADPYRGRFFHELSNFVNDHELTIADLVLNNDNFTYIGSNQSCATSWIDHIIASNSSSVSNIQIDYDLSIYDHIPISFNFKLPVQIPFLPSNKDLELIDEFIRWDKITEEELLLYQNKLTEFLEEFSYLESSIFCIKNDCNSKDHLLNLDYAFNYLFNSIKNASSHLKQRKNTKFKPIIGWNDRCKRLYNIARNNFLNWKSNGKIRSGEIFVQMKESRNNFKKALNFCKK